MLSGNKFFSRTPSYNISSLSDVLKPNTSRSFYTVNVGNGQILQVEMQVPQNLSLNYDLYLFTLDTATSKLTPVSGSQYATDSAFMAESAGAINNSGNLVTYAIMVDSNDNPSATDCYTLNVSVDNYVTPTEKVPTYALEPNESAFYALQFPNMTSTTSVTAPGGLNTPIDNDWFSLYIEDTSAFSGLEIEGVPSSVVVESYTVSGGTLMTKRGSTLNGDVLPIAPGYNYFRVKYSGSGAFST